jgi:S-DNA-T family DNA segregation ATPase FtsK/SpoIIIE
VIALPARPVWSRGTAATVPAAPAEPARPALRLVKAGPDYELAPPAPPEAAPATNRDRVLQAVRQGSTTAKAVVEATGLNKGTVSREVKALVEAGALTRTEDGTLAATAGEVSA